MKSAAFVNKAEALLAQLEVYKTSGGVEISSRDLAVVKRQVTSMILAAKEGRLQQPELRNKTLTRMVLDQWPLGHTLSRMVAEVDEAYSRLP